MLSAKKNAVAAAVFAFVIVLFYFLFEQGFLRFNYPFRGEFPVWGIDVSHHQGKIDWSKIENEELSFAYIKATEGGDFRDPHFKTNWEEAQRAGLRVGAYHFFTLCRPVEDQIANFLSVVPVGENYLPPALDMEFMGNCKASPIRVALPSDIDVFIEALIRKYDRQPLLYVTNEFYHTHLMGQSLKSQRIWIRDIFRTPTIPVPWQFWQFANRGRIDGIKGPVDLNVFHGSLEKFALLK